MCHLLPFHLVVTAGVCNSVWVCLFDFIGVFLFFLFLFLFFITGCKKKKENQSML